MLRLFARCIPGDLREPIAGDLHEEYLEIRERRGTAPRRPRGCGGSRCGWRVTFRWERAAHRPAAAADRATS